MADLTQITAALDALTAQVRHLTEQNASLTQSLTAAQTAATQAQAAATAAQTALAQATAQPQPAPAPSPAPARDWSKAIKPPNKLKGREDFEAWKFGWVNWLATQDPTLPALMEEAEKKTSPIDYDIDLTDSSRAKATMLYGVPSIRVA